MYYARQSINLNARNIALQHCAKLRYNKDWGRFRLRRGLQNLTCMSRIVANLVNQVTKLIVANDNSFGAVAKAA